MANKFEFVAQMHPVYDAWRDRWRENERRMRGGDRVLCELARFEWEEEKGDHIKRRRAEATYLNFPDMFATTIVGQMMRKAPKPYDEGALFFGELGEVTENKSSGKTPSQADQIYYNVDGVGTESSQWDSFWARVMRWAMATGHRWIFIEGAPGVATEVKLTKQDERNGKRPYLVHLSPLSVTNWHYEHGILHFAVIAFFKRNPTLSDTGRMEGNDPEIQYLVMTREGWQGFGSMFSKGGWWVVDDDMDTIKDKGNWDRTDGEIPLVPCFYERDSGEVQKVFDTVGGIAQTDGEDTMHSMSRPATTELGNAAISYMNLSSAADYDAWDAASSTLFLLGVDVEAFNLAVSHMKKGNKVIPIPANRESSVAPEIHDGSTGTVVAEVFDSRLERKLIEVKHLAVLESTSTEEGASGIAQQANFKDSKAPRLSLLAAEMEQAQTLVIRFIEMRYGHANPQGFTKWQRDYDLVQIFDAVNTMFALQKLAGVHSPTLTAQSLVAAARDKGLINDDETAEIVKKEYEEASERNVSNQEAKNELALTPDGAGKTRNANGAGGDGTGKTPGEARPNRAGINAD